MEIIMSEKVSIGILAVQGKQMHGIAGYEVAPFGVSDKFNRRGVELYETRKVVRIHGAVDEAPGELHLVGRYGLAETHQVDFLVYALYQIPYG